MSRKQHINQFGHIDPLATPEQLATKRQGVYDPRPVSGEKLGVRVRIVCGRCGKHLCNVVEFEKRVLYFAVEKDRWFISYPGPKCSDCYAPLETFTLDLQDVQRKYDEARHTGTAKVLKVGAK